MRRHHFIVVLIAILVALVFALWPWMTGDQEAPETPVEPVGQLDDYPRGSAIPWQPWGDAAQSRAAREGKGLFVYFHGQWCTWCREYQRDSLEHPETVTVIEQGFVPVLVNVDQRRDLFTRLGGRGLPFTVIMDDQGDVLGRFTGHVGAGDLQGLLREAAVRIATAQAVPAGLDALLDGDPEQFIAFLDETYDPGQHRLSRAAVVGSLSKRPQPMTYRLLLHEDHWRARIQYMLDVLRDDLSDPVDGGFFFFFDPDQPNPLTAVETSKVLVLNAQMVWLFAEAHGLLGRERDARVVREALAYVERFLWDDALMAFWGSQYSDSDYYRLPPAERRAATPPVVGRVQYADVSGQMIVALVRTAQALNEPAYLAWAARALGGLDERLADPDGGYYHFRVEGGEAQLSGYLPSQVWPAAAWWTYYEATGDEAAARRGAELLQRIGAHVDPELGGFAERLGVDLAPWTESRTHGALAWLLTGPASEARVSEDVLSPHTRAQWMRMALDHLRLVGGGDPDDMALGVLAQRSWAKDSGK
ncbi:thioredoxin family protein [Thioalkalivibrio sulfidiphilus]|uniref:thioredoxin family protein n=1 Tax=Thioalkalivibrio sulfidiphilus TaxID=1033854 RepID=UPI003B387395